MSVRPAPIWKQAVVDLIELDPQPGHIVTKDWLREHFEMTQPPVHDFDAMRSFEFKMLENQQKFFRALEQEHSLIFTDFDPRTSGRRLLAPGQVAKYEDKAWRRRMNQETRRTLERMLNTDQTQMTAEELEKHIEIMRRRSAQRAMLRKTNTGEIPVKFYVSDRKQASDQPKPEDSEK